ncbi:type II toxin-antitoxin system VapC family toxin [Sphingomonas rubra]|uniref:PIN domain nuclease, a component of toxin-antitoxin system (PIN domain) n=1 Tax=Sphingomonas rubra TaxID=634430 RepID=A0A1I5TVJ8_9SPHN|nr:type II toxin-antitoxin system VapC family toxin [Sphingomonas rubra]SFP86627.1 PIN domain nuclease, a component of toxin-antitoxin system (PIN domain) [Sphingomonas rubra]
MKLLIDTHVAIWWALGNEKLSLQGRALIGDPGNDISVSIATLWEIAVKNALQRSEPIGVSVDTAARLMDEAGFDVLAIERRHLLAIERLPLHHRDPFDRMLVAQAAVDGYRLVTHDRALAAYGDHVLLV